jgi:hypothetical protein
LVLRAILFPHFAATLGGDDPRDALPFFHRCHVHLSRDAEDNQLLAGMGEVWQNRDRRLLGQSDYDLLEGDAMLCLVGRALRRVPVELYLKSIAWLS